MTVLRSVALLLPEARATTDTEVASAPQWRGVCEYPEGTPAAMAIAAGAAALSAAEALPSEVRWVLHGGSSVQGALGWPVHHHIQHGIVGANGNALEVRQYCAGGLASWLLASGLLDASGAVICTGADNWSFGDRFVTSASAGGEPFSDVAHAEVLSAQGGFATILGTGTASRPGFAELWQTRDAYWQHPRFSDFRDAYSRAMAASTPYTAGESFRMLTDAATSALTEAQLGAHEVTDFVPPASASGQPYRKLAETLGLPWSDSLCEHYRDHGYLAVSAPAAGLVYLAQTGSLTHNSIVLLMATEYQLSTTAIVLRVARRPSLVVDGIMRVLA